MLSSCDNAIYTTTVWPKHIKNMRNYSNPTMHTRTFFKGTKKKFLVRIVRMMCTVYVLCIQDYLCMIFKGG